MIFLSSDQHFWHANIIKYCNRPYSSVEEMNEALINNWNSVVSPEDIVYCLGDFSMAFRSVELYSNRLLGQKLLVPGNHDMVHSFHRKSRDPENRAKWKKKYEENGWTILPEQTTLDIPGLATFNVCHHPYTDDNGHGEAGYQDKYARWRPLDDGRMLLCGHIHQHWKTKLSSKGTLMINVGVDVNEYKPVNVEDLKTLITNSQ